MVRLSFYALILFVVSWTSVSSVAQNASNQKFADKQNAMVVYGQGVHAFFDGHYKQAIRCFDKVDRIGTDDPRVYYFRGVVHTQLKNQQQADADFAKGARLEVGRPNYTKVINEALQRIQGKTRLVLETARSKQLKKLHALQIKQMNMKVSSPYDSPKMSELKSNQGNPNLPDSSKSNDPHLPFPNLKRTVFKTDTVKVEKKPDVFGKQDPLKATVGKPKASTKKDDLSNR